MVTFTAKPAENLLRAKSVAIVGASQKGAWPQGIYRNLKGAKYPGGVYLINPNYQELYGDKCYPNLAALPEVPDELLILIPTRAVLGVLEEAAKLGTRSATIYTAGFGEGDDEKGKERAQAMSDLCEQNRHGHLRAELHGLLFGRRGIVDVSNGDAVAQKRARGTDFSERRLARQLDQRRHRARHRFQLCGFQRQRSEPRSRSIIFRSWSMIPTPKSSR